MKTIGLTLGKYAPFHIGHQYVIDTALSECEEVHVVIYDTNEINIPLPIRANWIRKIYPKVIVHEAWGGPERDGLDPDVVKAHNNFLISILGELKVTHFYSAELYGDHVSNALNAIDRRLSRSQVPISSTLIRSNPYLFRKYVNPIVYKDLITKVVFLGAPSTGKSTITEEAAKQYHTVFMYEYGREYWNLHQVSKRLTPDQLIDIADCHIIGEEHLVQEANKYLFIDTNAITTYLFSKYYHGYAKKILQEYADETNKRYDLVFVCGDDIPYDDTSDRSGDANRKIFQKQTIAELNIRKIPYIILEGSVEDRLAKIGQVLAHFDRYDLSNNYYNIIR
jgi:HTH-type transcriptional regulator, transcriptional repressor of NAD biosynthesis genes